MPEEIKEKIIEIMYENDIKDSADQILELFAQEKHLAKQCLNFKGFRCDNKDCSNESCPLCPKKTK